MDLEATWHVDEAISGQQGLLMIFSSSCWFSFSFGIFPTAQHHQDITTIFSCWLLHWFLLLTAIPTKRKPFPFFGYKQICRSHSFQASTCSSKPSNTIPWSKYCTVNSTIHSPLCPPEPPLPFTVHKLFSLFPRLEKKRIITFSSHTALQNIIVPVFSSLKVLLSILMDISDRRKNISL